MTKTIRMTVAQAIVKFLDNQYVSMDGEETKFVEGFFTIFGHGIAVGLGEALDTDPGQLRVLQGRNEQGMCHVATAFAKQSNRKKIIPCASSVGPGAANMVTACATATVNNIPTASPADGKPSVRASGNRLCEFTRVMFCPSHKPLASRYHVRHQCL